MKIFSSWALSTLLLYGSMINASEVKGRTPGSTGGCMDRKVAGNALPIPV